ncbi:MAG TPA: ATP-binding protein [Pyrinomonadaceae bacterium]|jgi:PAS domain S-box-containing protein|nr:ATP-binding protein [Pyrinomonadaceae bacterium]
MRKTSDLKLVLFFIALTFMMTVLVVFAWEKWLLPPFYSWVDARYSGSGNERTRWNIQQRVEHFFISITVDTVVVTLLIRVVRRQQRRVSESEERYRALFVHALNGIALVRSSDHKLLEANARFCDILGCQAPALVGRDIRELLRTPADPSQGAAFFKLIDSAESGESELTVETTSGENRPVSILFSTLPEAEERRVILIIRDLSASKQFEHERAEMQQQLFQSSKLASIGELSAGVAHEINNPLNGIINFAQLLKDEPVERSEFERRMIDGIIDEGGRIAEIVRGLLTFARHDTHELRQVHIEETIKTSVALFGRQLEKDGIKVEIEVEENLPAVRADGSRLRQVVVNMISNAHQALKARPADASRQKVFRISARRAGRQDAPVVRIEFYDNGTGISREVLAKVFDPFFTTRRDTGGTGLGLSLSFGIVREHKGTIHAESVEGEFTRFTVELPAAEAWEAEYA